jgi:uncharacterized protein YpmB
MRLLGKPSHFIFDKTALMRMPVFIIVLIFIFSSAHSQQAVDLEENTPYLYNGLEFGYFITNEKSKEVKGEDYDRFELNLYVSNKSGGIKLFPFSGTSPHDEEEVVIAEFSCRNATGKRLTSKNGKVNAKPWFTQVKVKDETPGSKSKYIFIDAQAGYAIRNGQTITNKIIVIVPKGERPKVSFRVVYYLDM